MIRGMTCDLELVEGFVAARDDRDGLAHLHKVRKLCSVGTCVRQLLLSANSLVFRADKMELSLSNQL